MKQSTRRILTGILLLVFLFSITTFVHQQMDKTEGSSAYDDAFKLATSTKKTVPEPTLPVTTEAGTLPQVPQWIVAPIEEEDPHIPELEQISLEALREVNPDVVGWILIPDTNINYPLMQGTDNDFYLNHTWDKKSNAVGSIYLEYQCSPELTDFNTLVYGHNMLNGSMFAQLHKYTNQTYWEEHPYVYLLTDAGVYRYEIFSAYKADVDSATYGLSFQQELTKAKFLLHGLNSSTIQTGVYPERTDRILTLSTCSGAGYSNRWVVQARLKMIPIADSAA